MPVSFLDAPVGISPAAKQTMVAKITAALDEAYQIHDVRFFLREHARENVAQDGRFGAEPARPVLFLEAPPLRRPEVKRALVARLDAAIAEGYHGLINPKEILVLINEYPLDNAAAAGRLQAENPQIVAALERTAVG